MCSICHPSSTTMCFGFVERLEHVDIMTGCKEPATSTLEDSQSESGILDSGMSAVSKALKSTMRRAAEEGRLIGGLLHCAQILDTNADDVQFCVLPGNKCDDLTLGLHITLIEAFCWENDIPLLKVENVEKLSKVAGFAEEHRCFLVNFAEKETEDEKTVMEFFQENYDCVPQPIVNV